MISRVEQKSSHVVKLELIGSFDVAAYCVHDSNMVFRTILIRSLKWIGHSQSEAH